MVRCGDGWQIIHSGRRWGRFQYRVDAEECALRLAVSIRQAGGAARVFIHASGGQLVPLTGAG